MVEGQRHGIDVTNTANSKVFLDAAREPKRKVARAVKLFAEAQAELDEWSASNAMTGRLVAHADRLRVDIVLDAREEPPLESVALTVGDAVHNLRSALDNLAWTLANLSGPPPNPKAIQFPVSEKAAGWRKARRDLETLPAAALDRMEAAQPFVFDCKEDSFLWHLHQLDIADKHRGYLVAQPTWIQSTLKNLVFGVDAGTTMKPMSADSQMISMAGEVIGWLEFSKPFWDLGPVQGTVAVETAFLFMSEPGGPGTALHEMCHKFPLETSGIIDFVCGTSPN